MRHVDIGIGLVGELLVKVHIVCAADALEEVEPKAAHRLPARLLDLVRVGEDAGRLLELFARGREEEGALLHQLADGERREVWRGECGRRAIWFGFRIWTRLPEGN